MAKQNNKIEKLYKSKLEKIYVMLMSRSGHLR